MNRLTLRLKWMLVVLLLPLAGLVGCKSVGEAPLRITAADGQRFELRLVDGWFIDRDAGQTDILLVNAPLDSTDPDRQVVSIRIHWPVRGGQRGVANATVEWTILPPNPSDEPVRYVGTARARLDVEGGRGTLTLVDGRLRPSHRGGHDPIGHASFSGEFQITRDPVAFAAAAEWLTHPALANLPFEEQSRPGPRDNRP